MTMDKHFRAIADDFIADWEEVHLATGKAAQQLR